MPANYPENRAENKELKISSITLIDTFLKTLAEKYPNNAEMMRQTSFSLRTIRKDRLAKVHHWHYQTPEELCHEIESTYRDIIPGENIYHIPGFNFHFNTWETDMVDPSSNDRAWPDTMPSVGFNLIILQELGVIPKNDDAKSRYLALEDHENWDPGKRELSLTPVETIPNAYVYLYRLIEGQRKLGIWLFGQTARDFLLQEPPPPPFNLEDSPMGEFFRNVIENPDPQPLFPEV